MKARWILYHANAYLSTVLCVVCGIMAFFSLLGEGEHPWWLWPVRLLLIALPGLSIAGLHYFERRPELAATCFFILAAAMTGIAIAYGEGMSFVGQFMTLGRLGLSDRVLGVLATVIGIGLPLITGIYLRRMAAGEESRLMKENELVRQSR